MIRIKPILFGDYIKSFSCMGVNYENPYVAKGFILENETGNIVIPFRCEKNNNKNMYSVNINCKYLPHICLEHIIDFELFCCPKQLRQDNIYIRITNGAIIQKEDLEEYYLMFYQFNFNEDNNDTKYRVIVYHNGDFITSDIFINKGENNKWKKKYFSESLICNTLFDGKNDLKKISLIQNKLLPKLEKLENNICENVSAIRKCKDKIFEFDIPCDYRREHVVAKYLAMKEPTFKQINAGLCRVSIKKREIQKIALFVACLSHNRPIIPNDIYKKVQSANDYLVKAHIFFELQSICYKDFLSTYMYFYRIAEIKCRLRNWEKQNIKDKIDEIFVCLVGSKTSRNWVKEQELFLMVNDYYKDAVFQYRCNWLGNLSIDIYIPSIKVGIEYQGLQHYEPLDHWGGNEGLLDRIEKDNRKKQLCLENGIKLIEWDFSEPITETLLLSKLNKVLNTQHAINIYKL